MDIAELNRRICADIPSAGAMRLEVVSADAARVAVCGLGGLGSNVAIALARAGVGHLHLIDFDRVDTREASAVLVGSGDIDLKLLRTASTRLSLKGSGDIDAQFSEGCGSVACELRGSGDINLEGQVHQFTKQKSGSGDINTDRLTIR